MTAQGIEAATADKTRSGLAEGESPVRQDAPNPLYQEGYSMVDTTDQQAVTVAQPSDAATRLALTATPETFPRDSYGLAQWIDRGLASVSFASAETVDYRALLIQAGRNAGAFIDDRASDAFLKFIPEEVRLKIERLTASPEPVPATNQAGEVDFPREQIARLCLLRLYGFEYDGESLCDEAERIFSEPNPRAVRAVALADEIAAALATQPATSQEGEVCALCSGKGFADAQCPVCMMAAAPTPPTLSEDLREVIARTLYLRRNPSEYSSNDSYQWQIAQGLDLSGYYADADAILAETPGFTALSSDLQWFGTQRRLSLSFHSPMYGDDDDQSEEWRVHKESGPINDREWDVIGRGQTGAKAIAAARAALAQVKAS